MEVSGIQIRMARVALDWSAAHLAERAGCSLATVQRCEGGAKTVPAVKAAIVAALEGEGIEFIEGGARRKPEAKS
ncbi:MAG: helix-turn-helix domain-containing protein [Beijerinckiaceae bacterium]